jgi:hypothetical protein
MAQQNKKDRHAEEFDRCCERFLVCLDIYKKCPDLGTQVGLLKYIKTYCLPEMKALQQDLHGVSK